MNDHLSPQEFVESIEGTLSSGRLDHLASCETCRSELAGLQQLLTDVEASAPVPQPSPLFWDHFSERVRLATTAAGPAPRAPRWAPGWRPIAAFAGGLALVILAFALRPGAPVAVPAAPAVADAALADSAVSASDDLAAEMFVTIASTLPWEDVEQVAMPRADTVDNLIEQLTPAEREELARLIRARIGDLE
jgi:hypothetical protein